MKIGGHVPSARNHYLRCVYFHSEIAFSHLLERDFNGIQAQQSVSFCGRGAFGTDVVKLAALLMKTH